MREQVSSSSSRSPFTTIEMASALAEEEGPITRENILQLVNQRKDVDEQIQALGGILESNHVGMNDPLVDREGYPRNDIDVYQVRHARQKIICLQNDFKRLTKEIDEKLVKYHQQLKENGGSQDPMGMEVDSEASAFTTPIAKVNLVSEASPVFHAGVLVDDLIVEFGSVNSSNFKNLADIGNLVQRNAGNVLKVRVKRDAGIVKLALIPGPWSGRGLLGCNIVPYEAVDR